MSNTKHLDTTKRHEFVLLYDVIRGNPNGDPDASGQPRIDPASGKGLVTDVAIKRKIRNVVPLVVENDERYQIFVQNSSDVALNDIIDAELPEKVAKNDKDKSKKGNELKKALCERYFDVRMFGAVLSTGNASETGAKVQGPVQITFAESLSPVDMTTYTITRQAPTKAGDPSTMGEKSSISYGLYKQYGFFSPHLAAKTGVLNHSDGVLGDLGVLWDSIRVMFDAVDRSASRGMVSLRGLVVFSHDNPLGNAPAHQLLESVETSTPDELPQQYSDYSVSLPDVLPDGVTMTVLVQP